VRLLLDTHIAIWATQVPDRLSVRTRDAIEDPDNDVFVSAAAVWEIAIKRPLGRGDAPPMSARQALVEFESADFAMLAITARHAAFVERLPAIHADPFDRMMLAQALVDDLLLVTVDRPMMRYDVPIWPEGR
jgi:PIN domain nuclease of toxin-antitoxin system